MQSTPSWSTVQGDTISEIAFDTEVPIDHLIEVHKIRNPKPHPCEHVPDYSAGGMTGQSDSGRKRRMARRYVRVILTSVRRNS